MTESVLVYAQTSTRSPVVTSLKRGTPVSVDVTIARPDLESLFRRFYESDTPHQPDSRNEPDAPARGGTP